MKEPTPAGPHESGQRFVLLGGKFIDELFPRIAPLLAKSSCNLSVLADRELLRVVRQFTERSLNSSDHPRRKSMDLECLFVLVPSLIWPCR